MRRFFVILLFVVHALLSIAQGLSVEQVRNPKLVGQDCFVSDVGNILSTSTRSELNSMAYRLEQATGVEFAIVVVPSIEGDDEYAFAYDLFNYWRIGKEGKNNGLLWLYVVDIRAMKFETGYGLEGLLPDAYLSSLLEDKIFPYMRKSEVDKAYSIAMNNIFERLTTEEALEELLLSKHSPRNIMGDIISAYFILAFFVLILLSIFVYYKGNRLRGKNNVRYAQFEHVLLSLKVFAFIFPLPVYLFYLYVKRQHLRLRTRPISCAHCGGSMTRLSEQDEDLFLTAKQQSEERVKSVDYDVWMCNVCDNYEVLAYSGEAKGKYQICPICGAQTNCFVDTQIVRHATYISSGTMLHIYQCANCHNRNEVTEKIPRKQVVVASGVGGGSRGGFSGGGGFGGGFSGGGGAGGRF